ncbi:MULTISPECIES: TolC family protein [Gammaproteobacteria]|jgi:cobalt-zinc-cadmium efflux system outer membrane protein|uniref:TolC family protein n=5 Tax=Gammaproteobacteria TaxID=1236 RepID=A0A246HL09_STEMA|nr:MULTISPECIES: TolC family protein [Pseudomonadota]MBU2047416.1 TolC family protein [Gammaproteobacteria bacterium]ELC7363574.1 TolC family protein [Stenotrophomonas maltophilia]KRG60227.1 transporter [Stenotrophomonas nitritireducens]MBA0251840.1 TolC family protein [Stenotrophomonas maltophilia]MBA0319157.1 TolC family protein [Stenotrophomonas maltophilia]
MSILPGRSLSATGLTVAILLALVPIGHVAAQTAPSYESLLSRLNQMPATVQGVALAEAAEARVQQARALPNPTVSIEAENAYGTGPYKGFSNADSIVTLSQPLEIWGQRGARVRAARAEAGAAGLRGDLMRSDAAGRLAATYAEAEAALRRYELASEALALIEQDAKAVAAMVSEGREPNLRGVQARSEVANAKASLDEAEAYRDAALARLAGVSLVDSPLTDIGESLLDRVPSHPVAIEVAPLAVRIAQAEAEASGRLIDVERKRALPQLSASVAQTRFRQAGDQAYNVGISLSIPLFDRNRGAIQAAYAEQRAAEAVLEAQRRDSEAARLGAVASLKASNSRVRAADESVQAADEAYRLARIGFEAGRISQLELRSTRSTLIAARGSAVDARLSRVAAEIDLARLEGRAPFVEAK